MRIFIGIYIFIFSLIIMGISILKFYFGREFLRYLSEKLEYSYLIKLYNILGYFDLVVIILMIISLVYAIKTIINYNILKSHRVIIIISIITMILSWHSFIFSLHILIGGIVHYFYVNNMMKFSIISAVEGTERLKIVFWLWYFVPLAFFVSIFPVALLWYFLFPLDSRPDFGFILTGLDLIQALIIFCAFGMGIVVLNNIFRNKLFNVLGCISGMIVLLGMIGVFYIRL